MTAIETITRPSHPANVQQILISDLRPAQWNARKTFDEKGLQELGQSIFEHGVLVPLVVRPIEKPFYVSQGEFANAESFVWYVVCKNSVGHENICETYGAGSSDENKADAEAAAADRNPDGVYEIVCGHRRMRAAQIAGADSVPCEVRELTDEAAREIGLIDNLQRADVPPLEEADAFDDLLERTGSIAAVAGRVGKEQSYVARRLKLRTLTTWSRDALRHQIISIDHAMLLCRLAEAEQNEALKWCLDSNAGVKVGVDKVIAARLKRLNPSEDDEDDDEEENGQPSRPSFRHTWEPQTAQKLKDHIETSSGVPLDRAPWPIEEDWLLPDAGSCLDCEKNTKANTPLFGDLDMGVAVCTDGACFKAKVHAFVEIRLGKAVPVGESDALRVSWKSTSSAPRMAKDGSGLNLKQVFRRGQWHEASGQNKSKKCEHSRAAVAVDWSDADNRGYMGGRGELRRPGEILEVCIEPKCKVHVKSYAGQKQHSAERQESYEEREKREEAELAAFVAVELPVRRALYDAIAEKLTGEKLLRAAMLRGKNFWTIALGLGKDPRKQKGTELEAAIRKASGADLDRLFFHSTFGRALEISRWERTQKDKGRGDLISLAAVAGVDAAAIQKRFEAPKPTKTPAAKKAAAKKPLPAKKTVLDAATRKRIADAQRKRWAAAKKGGKR